MPGVIPVQSIPLGALAATAGGEDSGTGTQTIEVYLAVGPPNATDLCNGAIDLVGAGVEAYDQILDFVTDTSRLADHCRRRFHRARRRALLKWPWPEAGAYLPGTAGDTDFIHPTYDFTYSYQIPVGAGLLALRRIVNASARPLLYDRHGDHILTNYLPSEFWWHFTLDLAGPFSEGLGRCIEYELAIDLCGPLLRGEAASKRRVELHQEYREIGLPDAARQAQDEQYDQTNAAAPIPWIEIT